MPRETELPGLFPVARGANDAEAERLFASLAEGGQVQMPLTKTFYSSRFGMVADRFGVCWMVIVAP
jgi:PhnB protein